MSRIENFDARDRDGSAKGRNLRAQVGRAIAAIASGYGYGIRQPGTAALNLSKTPGAPARNRFEK